MRDALAKVKADLGPNAIILSTQRIDDGIEGLGASLVEVTATTDEATQRDAHGLRYFQRTSRGRAPMPLERRAFAPAGSGAPMEGEGASGSIQPHTRSWTQQGEGELLGHLKTILGPLMEEVRDLRHQVDRATREQPAVLIRPGQAPEPFASAAVEPSEETLPPLALEIEEEAPSAPERLPWLPVDSMLTRLSPEDRIERPIFQVKAIEPEPEEEGAEDEALAALRRSLMGVDQARSLVKYPLEQLGGWLADSDVAPDRRAALVESVRMRLDGEPVSRETVERAFIQELLGRVTIRPRQELDKRRRVALVGPTGVGKTTTLAKIAAEARLDKRRSVGMMTIDTYRIGGVDQLRKYANLLEVPLEVVVDRLSLERALRRLDHCDLLLIDTIGRSPRDEEPVRRLAELFEGIAGLSFELCISATTALRDMQGIARNYRHLAPESVLFTKLDEAFAAGPLLSSHMDVGIPLSFFTTGQSVPEDIEHASVERLLGMILPLAD